MRTPLLSIVVWVCLLGLAAPAQAQIVNVLGKTKNQAPEGLSGGLKLSGTYKSGNISLRQIKGEFGLAYRQGDHLVYLLARGGYGDKPSAATANSPARNDPFLSETFEHIRYRYRLMERLWLEAYGQHEMNLFRDLRFRTVAGAGPRLAMAIGEAGEVALGAAVMAELEHYRENAADPDSGALRWRSSNYVQGGYALNEQSQVSATVFFQPRLDDFADYRVLGELALSVKARENLSLGLALRLDLDTRPPGSRLENSDAGATVGGQDTAIESTLGWSF